MQGRNQRQIRVILRKTLYIKPRRLDFILWVVETQERFDTVSFGFLAHYGCNVEPRRKRMVQGPFRTWRYSITERVLFLFLLFILITVREICLWSRMTESILLLWVVYQGNLWSTTKNSYFQSLPSCPSLGSIFIYLFHHITKCWI